MTKKSVEPFRGDVLESNDVLKGERPTTRQRQSRRCRRVLPSTLARERERERESGVRLALQRTTAAVSIPPNGIDSLSLSPFLSFPDSNAVSFEVSSFLTKHVQHHLSFLLLSLSLPLFHLLLSLPLSFLILSLFCSYLSRTFATIYSLSISLYFFIFVSLSLSLWLCLSL